MKAIRRLLIAVVCVLGFFSSAAAQDPLADAKGLYEAASYREALTALDHASAGDVTEVETYRALCLLALGLQRDAEQSLAHLAISRPLFSLEGTDVSPRLMALFGEVRKRTLPEAAKHLYQDARASFDAGNITDATRQFKATIELADKAAPENAALLSELKVLAEGFLKLSEASAATSKPQSPDRAAELAPEASAAIPSDRVYGSGSGARPAIPLDRTVPPWERPASLRALRFTGIIEVEIDEQGRVTSATIKKSLNVAYDPLLLAAAKKWRFQPAMFSGHPVKYRTTYPVTVGP